jgi:enoyl-CoA hydratase
MRSTPEQLLPTAHDGARSIASKSPVATKMFKHTMNTIEDMSLRDGYRYEQDMTAAISKTEDAKEAQAVLARSGRLCSEASELA